MSVIDDLSELEERVRDRLRELEPLVGEYQRLQEVAERLGIDYQTGAARSSRRSGVSSRSRSATRRAAASRPSGNGGTRSKTVGTGRSRAGSRKRAAPGRRDEQVLAAVQKKPGITVAEIGKSLRTDPTSLYRVVRRLESAGQIRKQGRELQPVR